MEEVSGLFVAIALLILFAATSMRFGVDSRDGFRGRRGERVPQGIVWDVPAATPKPLTAAKRDESRLVPAPADCGLAPCVA